MFRKISLFSLGALALLCSSCEKKVDASYSLIPTPITLEKHSSGFELKDGVVIGVADSTLLPAAEYLRTVMRHAGKMEISHSKGDIVLSLIPDCGKPRGYYKLAVSPEKIVVKAADYEGVIHAISTMRQMLPVAMEAEQASDYYILPSATVEDAPRFGWRGMMMDASRHFWTKEEVKSFLDMMALYKFNKFHWHLTDDQGWRIEIKKYPLLTENGAWRTFNSQDRFCMNKAAREDNPDMQIPEDRIKVVEGDSVYGGFYTQDDVREIVAYAAQRGIEIIPEVDMPGHFLAAISQYPDVACSGMTGWGAMFSSPVCPGKDSSIEFCKNIYREIFGLFPSQYVHIGADEVEKTNWKKCRDCQKRVKNEHLESPEELQAWFVRNMESFFRENGKRMLGWDEVVEDGLTDQSVIVWWRSWCKDAAYKAAAQGKQVVECPNYCFYFDAHEDKNSIPHILDFDPFAGDFTEEQKALVLGLQANLWAEGIPSMERLEYMAMPRMIALAEKAWAQPERMLTFEDYQKAVIPHFYRMDKLGVNYRVPSLSGFYQVNAFVDTVNVTVTSPLPGITVRYTTDGSIPNSGSALYTEPMRLDSTVTYTFRTFRPDGSASDFVRTRYVKAPYAPALAVEGELESGLNADWYDYAGEKCSEITTARLNRSMVVDQVAIPEGVSGNIGLVFSGYIDVPEDGIYTFSMFSDDGSTITIDGDFFLDNDGGHSPLEVVAQKALKKGLHAIEITYFDHNGGLLELNLLNDKGEKMPVPQTWFKHIKR